MKGAKAAQVTATSMAEASWLSDVARSMFDAFFGSDDEYTQRRIEEEDRRIELQALRTADALRRAPSEAPAPAPPAPRESSSAESSSAPRLQLLELGPDVLGVLIDGIAEPLHPELPVALSQTCKALGKLLRATLERLEQEHKVAVDQWLEKLGRSMSICSVAKLSFATKLDFPDRLRTNPVNALERVSKERVYLSSHDLAVLGMLLRTNRIPKLLELNLRDHISRDTDADAAVHSLFDNLGAAGTPCLQSLSLVSNGIGPLGAISFAASLGRGAARRLQTLDLGNNTLRNKGLSALAAPLRRLPALRKLRLAKCAIGDKGAEQLICDLSELDFPSLRELMLDYNHLTCSGFASLTAALNRRHDDDGAPLLHALPRLRDLYIRWNHAFPAAVRAMEAALTARGLVADDHVEPCPGGRGHRHLEDRRSPDQGCTGKYGQLQSLA